MNLSNSCKVARPSVLSYHAITSQPTESPFFVVSTTDSNRSLGRVYSGP